jgi:hypothetical protein
LSFHELYLPPNPFILNAATPFHERAPAPLYWCGGRTKALQDIWKNVSTREAQTTILLAKLIGLDKCTRAAAAALGEAMLSVWVLHSSSSGRPSI